MLLIVFVGAFQSHRNWRDLYSLMFFGTLGWPMTRMRWPRPPLILGLVLGYIVERYLFVSLDLYGTDWLYRPVVIIVLGMAAWGLLFPLRKKLRRATVACSASMRQGSTSKPFSMLSPLAVLAG